MRKRSSEFMTDYVTNQFPIVKFKEMIFAYLNIVELFQVMLNDKDYYIRITPTYELRTSSGKLPTNSKIESFVIKKYDNKVKMEDCVLQYPMAFNELNEEERQVFLKTFVERKKDIEIIEELRIHSVKLNTIRKSAIVRFSIKLGFDKYVKNF
jgi:ArpU family phage transcriptional regulator